MAAQRRTGDDLVELLIEAGFGDKPKMTIVVKRPRKAEPKREPPRDPLEWRDADKYAYLQDDFAGMLIAV